jgi:antitoxin (DNA-binding transcriptional repressor) of toxin-antitoxin stability system
VSDIKTVGVKDLKNNLSAYLRDVRRGARILVSDRNAVIAELHEPTATYAASETTDPIVAGWIREGVVTPPSRQKAPLPRSAIRVDEGTATRLVDEDRDEARQ